MSDYWIKYTYTIFVSGSDMKMESSDFAYGLSTKKLSDFCDELDDKYNNFKIEQIVKL